MKKTIISSILILLILINVIGCFRPDEDENDMTYHSLLDSNLNTQSDHQPIDLQIDDKFEAEHVLSESNRSIETQDKVEVTTSSELARGENDESEDEGNRNEAEVNKSNSSQITYIDKDGKQGSFETNIDALFHAYSWDYLSTKGGYLSYHSSQTTSRLGIDVSEYQGDIDWQRVKESGVTFVFIRLGYRGYGEEGALVLDKNYHANMSGALAAELNTGVYFFSQAINEEEAREEAQFVIDNLIGYNIDAPIMYDPEKIEGVSARTDQVSGEEFTKHAMAFCDTIKENGYEVGIYTDILWQAEELDMSKLKEYTIWYSDYEENPQTPYQFTFWQYSEKGSVDGIQVPVDLNLHFIIP